MSLRSRIEQKVLRTLGKAGFQNVDRFATTERAEPKGEIERLFYTHRGRVVHKWAHYLPIYDRHFEPFRGRPIRLLEIGVFKGGSLELWRDYFGLEAIIFGIDIDPDCALLANPPNQVRIGSQNDPAFLASVIEEMGAPDIIIDDGSHIASHQITSFEALFPVLNVGGLYVIEDTHTAFWPGFEGGYRSRNSVIGLANRIIDDLHAWYHPKPTSTPAKTEITGLHVYDSLVIIEKGRKTEPRHIMIGVGDACP